MALDLYSRQVAGWAMADIFEYMEVFYNRRRLHSALGYQTPVTYELGNDPP